MPANAATPLDGGGQGADRARVKSAERVAEVLEFLASHRRPQRLVDIMRGVGLPKSSGHALVNTLVDCGLVMRDESGNHRLGLRLLAYADAALQQFDLGVLARPALEGLCQKLNGVCNLGALSGHNVTYLQAVQAADSPIQITTRVGGHLPAHATAMGKVLVGEMDEPERSKWIAEHEFRQIAPATIVDADGFLKAVERYRDRGYAVDDEESLPGVMCVAAPIVDHRRVAIAAVSFTDLKPRMRDRKVEAVAAEIVAVAAEISARFGGAGAGTTRRG